MEESVREWLQETNRRTIIKILMISSAWSRKTTVI